MAENMFAKKMGPAVKIGIIRSSSIGDVVLATACINLLEQLPAAVEILWIGKNPSLSLIKESFPQVQIKDMSKYTSTADLVKELVDMQFLVDLQVNLRSRRLTHQFRKLTQRKTYQAEKNRFFRNKLVLEAYLSGRKRQLPSAAQNPPKKQFEDMVAVVFAALEENVPTELIRSGLIQPAFPRIPVKDTCLQEIWNKELKWGVWIGIACGASFATKRAPLDLFAKVIHLTKDLLDSDLDQPHLGLGIVFLGDHNDRKLSSELIDKLHWNDPYLNLSGQLTLRQTAVALSQTAVVLTNDTCISHIAEAVGTPAGVLFGPTVEGFGFAPFRKESRAFSVPIGCRPCSKHGKSKCRFSDHLCFNNIDAFEVAKYLSTLIKKAATQKSETPFINSANLWDHNEQTT